MSTPAVRTVAEDDRYHVVEGLAFPFKGRDTYGTFFSARTNFEWGLFPDTDPTGSVRDAAPEPAYIRPATFHHGFDPDFKLTDENGNRVGGWSPVRMDADGVWVRAQLDKRHAYYEKRLRPLLEEGALGLSGGSAEHSVRIDQRSGEILDWPAYELAFTPVESNPLAVIAARAGEVVTVIASEATRRDIPQAERDRIPAEDFAGPDKSFPIAEPEDVAAAAHAVGRAADPDAVKARIIAIAKRKGADFTAQLPEAWQDGSRSDPAYREGRRNSTADQQQIDAAHQAAHAAMSATAALGASCADCGAGQVDTSDDDDDGTRSAPPAAAQPAMVTIAVRENAGADLELARQLAARADEVALEVVRQLTG